MQIFTKSFSSVRVGLAPLAGGSVIRRWPLGVKRLFDCSVALVGLILLFPVVVVTALAIRLSMGCPILFRQKRPGRYGKPFILLKFRTMSNRKDASGELLPDADRLTRFGRILRALSVDELPQLWNVLCGDLSLVGPRPLLMEYLPLYTLKQARRHEAMPGITGWAQINGRNALTWEEKLDLDVWYVDHWSLALDFKILWLTLPRVFMRKGISQEGHATMPKFIGQTTRQDS